MINRRGLLFGALAAPAIIKLAPLMRISPARLGYPDQVILGQVLELSGTWTENRPVALEASMDKGMTWIKVSTISSRDGPYSAIIPRNIVAGQSGSLFIRETGPIVTRKIPAIVST